MPRRFLMVLLAGLMAGTVAAPAAGALPKSFFGMQDYRDLSSSEFQALGGNGVGTVRLDMAWRFVETTPGARNWENFDGIVGAAARANVRLLPVLTGSPAFIASKTTYPPLSPEARQSWLAYVRDIVARYGQGGTYWRDNPAIPVLPIHSWQIWNEPNYPAYWYERPNARQYVGFLKSSAQVVRSTDPTAEVVMAGLPETQNGIPVTKFLKQIYRVRGAKKWFDVVALHPYARDHRGVLGSILRARQTMRRRHDGKTPIWITEVGWATAGDVSPRTRPFRTTLQGQARRLRATVRTLRKHRRRQKIRGFVWYSYHDKPQEPGERNWWGLNTGLLMKDGQPKPGWAMYTRLATRR